MRNHEFLKMLGGIKDLNPSQLRDVSLEVNTHSGKRAALDGVEMRAEQMAACPHCNCADRQKWGYTRTGVQRFRCQSCLRTWSGLTGSSACGIHRPDLFLMSINDMMSDTPLSCRKLSSKLGICKDTIWRWRMIVLRSISGASSRQFSGIVEVDETYQRESRKGSREWSRHSKAPHLWPAPPRLRWSEYHCKGINMKRGLSKWQIPILTIADRSGAKYLEKIQDTKSSTIHKNLTAVLSLDCVLCSDKAKVYSTFAKQNSIEHFRVGSKPGTRLASAAHHIQNVNALHSRLKMFMKPFCGPASKNLSGYLDWSIARSSKTAGEVFQLL